MSQKHFISNKNETSRMFKTDFMEAFSRTHWTVPLWLFVPVIGYLIFLTIGSSINFFSAIGFFFFGLFVWTFAEYFMHRFVFHYVPKSKIGKRVHWIMHGVHHDYPQDAKRLVLPPSLSIPFSTAFYLLFYYLIPTPNLYPYFAGFLVGYLFYDIGHYAMHHFSFKNKFFKKIKLHHMKHHYVSPHEGYGVSSPLWDIILRTDSENQKEK